MSKSNIQVIKRDGTKEDFNPEKIHKVIEWAIDGYDGVSVSEIEINAELKFTNGITTEEVHNALIDSSRDLIKLDSPNYQYVAARLLTYKLRKDVWGGPEAPNFLEFVSNLVSSGHYDPSILESYTEEEFDTIEGKIDHDRDDLFTFAGLQQMCDKYLVQDRTTKKLYETPQFAFMLVAMTLFANYSKKKRMKYAFKAYDYISKFKISLPTPIISGVRTPLKRYASCCLIDVDDTLESLAASNTAVLQYTASRSGIGLNMGRIRGINSPIRNGEVSHTGVVPFLKWFESTVKSCHQNGVRGGSLNSNTPVWHQEIEDIITLKNNTKTGDNSVRGLDYTIGFSELFYKRFLESMKTGKDVMITLFSPHDVPGLYDAFGHNDKFDPLYIKYENDPTIPKKQISAKELMSLYTKERRETARIYAFNADHVNSHSAWLDTVHMSNLCVTGDQRAITDRGILTVKELQEQGGDLVLFDGDVSVNASPMTLIEKDADVYEVTLENGLTHKITDYHKLKVKTGQRSTSMIPCKDLKVGDKVKIQTKKGIFGKESMVEEAFLLGIYQSDGTQMIDKRNDNNRKTFYIDLWENDFDLIEEIESNVEFLYKKYLYDADNDSGRLLGAPKFADKHTLKDSPKSKRLGTRLFNKIGGFEKSKVPDWIWKSDEKTQWSYIRGLFYGDGTVNVTESKGFPLYLSITQNNLKFIKELQILLLNLGMSCSIHDSGEEGNRVFREGQIPYFCKKTWRLIIGNKNDALEFERNTNFLSRKGKYIEDREYRDNTKKHSKIKSIEYIGKEDVYCTTVDSEEHLWSCNGFITSNCVEITQPTIPIKSVDDPNGEIGVCILAALNVLNLKSDLEIKTACDLSVRMLDELIDHQTYPIKAAENFTTKRRSLGIGVTNLAALFAKNNLRYDDPDSSDAPNFVDELFEKIQYNLIDTSVELAKEKGACEKFDRTTYSKGILPIDTYNKNVDSVVTRKPSKDWDALREKVLSHGMRNSTLTAIMPCESSSVVSNSTNGIEPIKQYLIFKSSKVGNLPFIVPNYSKWKNRYTLQFDMKNNKGYSNITGAIQKWIDMAISCMHYYNYEHYEENKLPDSKLIQEMLYHYKMGNKTLYYTYSNDMDKQSSASSEETEPELMEEEEVELGCAGGSCSL